MDNKAIETFKTFLTAVWAPQLERHAFKGKDFEYTRDRGPYRDTISVEPNAEGSAVRVRLTVHAEYVRNSGDYGKAGMPGGDRAISSRYLAVPGTLEGFWTIQPQGPVTLPVVLEDLHALFLTEGLPFFETISKLHQALPTA